MTLKNKIRLLVLLVAICLFFLGSSNLIANSNQAVVPINITVQGKLIISDATNDNKSGIDPSLNILLRLTPDLNSSIVSGSSGIRIRTNLNNWKLTAQRSNFSNSVLNIDPEDVSLSFTTQAGSKANPGAGVLVSPFNGVANLSQISTNSPTEILVGSSMTSIDKDPENKNNWFQLTTNYSILPDFFYGIGEVNTTVSYNLVSP